MNFPTKLLFPIAIIAAAVVALVVYFSSSKTDGSVTPSNTPTPSPQSVATKEYSDDTSGLSFWYPSNFDIEKSTDSEGTDHLTIDPFNSDPENRTMREAAGLLKFTFLKGTTLEKEVADDTNPESHLENVQVQDITINVLQGKRISYSAPIGLDGLTTLVQWNNSILQISYYPGGQSDMVFEDIIKSVKNTKR